MSTDAKSNEEVIALLNALSSADLEKQINDDYAVILGSERANLPRALAIAPKLHVLRMRAWGKWKTKFDSHNLQMSYETASVYLRIWERWAEIKKLAAEKGVDPTLLTIDAARELLAKKKSTATTAPSATTTSATTDGGGKPTVEAMEAKQAANAVAEANSLADDADDAADDVEGWFVQAVKVFSQDELMNLTERLAKHLGMTLVPEDTWAALEAELTKPTTPTTTTTTTGFERRI
jgi:hypothetical protein